MTADDLAQIEAAAYRGALRAIQDGLFHPGASPLASPISRQQQTERMVAEGHRKIEEKKARKLAKARGEA